MSADHQHAGSSEPFLHRGIQTGPMRRGAHVGIAVARFNGAITRRLFAGAVDELLDAGDVSPGRIVAVEVPGCIELPLATQALARQEGMRMVVALGCVIRGQTAHFDYVCRIASDGCRQVMLDEHIPLGFGVLTTDDADQAANRAEIQEGGRNAGRDAAAAALAMYELLDAGAAGPGMGFA